ncbi:MAG: nucleoside-diphosphate-sugar pyrophosphorylase [Deltaproteobacteria bacterium RBG_16_49_23]|nr:MAG: nucleoside-diphosphate-sugar pyrophosphorylase [Deltaproteobacteria bacterium RBG_16_49_23]
MKAVILAGGKGTRLRPYTTVIPKPLLPVGNYPILEIILKQLRGFGVHEVVLAVGHMAQLFQAFFQDGQRYGLKIRYSLETKSLGTAGPLSLLMDEMKEDFLVMNGDLLTTLNFRRMFEYHCHQGAAATIGLYQREVKIDFGVVETNHDNRLSKYTEKPVFKFSVSMGVNVLNPKVVRPYLIPGRFLDLPDLMVHLRDDGYPVYCYSEPCFWLDIGREDDYQKANEIFESHMNEFISDGSLP